MQDELQNIAKAASKPSTPIEALLSQNEIESELLMVSIERLTDRLSPVSSGAVPVREDEDKEYPGSSALSSRLNKHNLAVRRATQLLNDLANSLEV